MPKSGPSLPPAPTRRARPRAGWRAWFLAAAVTALALGAPLLLDTYRLRVATTVLMFAILASALNLVAGYAGYPAFGNVVFYGIGAYSTAISMTRLGVSFEASVGIGVLVAALAATGIGLPLLRLRGHYFAIATLGMNEATRALADNWSGLTGGGMGLSIPTGGGGVAAVNRYFYFVMLAILAAVVGVASWMGWSRFGYGCRAIRYDEEAATSCGVPTTRYKLTAWVLSAVFTSMAGSAYAYWFGYIEPSVVFDLSLAVKMFVMMLLGGPATPFGPVVGAVLVELVEHLAWSRFLAYHGIVFALVIIGVVIFVPGGLSGVIERVWLRSRWVIAGTGVGGHKRSLRS
jgi:branched-chain amino acid transport system permease protein